MGGFRLFFTITMLTLLVVSFTSADTQDDVIDAKVSVADIFVNNPTTVLVAVSGDNIEMNCVRDVAWNSFTC